MDDDELARIQALSAASVGTTLSGRDCDREQDHTGARS
jgi:hypothetical protein